MSLKLFFFFKYFLQVEYEISQCDSSTVSANGCIDTKRMSFNMPRGGNVIYGVAHQHSGGIGSALYRKVNMVIYL